jgi:hypothetical protein
MKGADFPSHVMQKMSYVLKVAIDHLTSALTLVLTSESLQQ